MARVVLISIHIFDIDHCSHWRSQGAASRGQAPVSIAEAQVVVPLVGLHRFSIACPAEIFGPVSRADPAQGGVQLYYCLMNTATDCHIIVRP